jgi:hypothetical protein
VRAAFALAGAATLEPGQQLTRPGPVLGLAGLDDVMV